jgi:hypothetical protein
MIYFVGLACIIVMLSSFCCYFLELEDEDEAPAHHNKTAILNSIRDHLRNSLPITAIAKTENITHPTTGPVI